ncbi:MAG: (d)CMP kinase [Neisseriaceae bacterium]|nr:(d)CMP kinase [Neisseriaceae bacterium]
MSFPVIAIDGPSASGKGTIAVRVAQKLGWAYLDSGALYRLTALLAQQEKVHWQDESAVAQLAKSLPVCFENGKIFLNQQEVTEAIRAEEIGMGASKIAALPAVRTALLQRQRDFAEISPTVADGRDMASVVFPDAVLKIFLTASAQVRAQRRAKQIGQPEHGEAFEKILADIEKRDEADCNRPVAPLVKQPDALLLDTSNMTIDEAVNQVLVWYNDKV